MMPTWMTPNMIDILICTWPILAAYIIVDMLQIQHELRGKK